MSATNSTPIKGDRFGRWLVTSGPIKHNSRWSSICQCDCGCIATVRNEKLVSGKSKSCGCLRNDNLTTHGMTKRSIRRESHEYWIWNTVVQRCTNPNIKNWSDYGGRGITVCEEWLKFENFFADMGKRPTTKHSIERVDNNSGYSPGNCRWATREDQAKNKRNNRAIELFGVSKHLAEWAREYGISHTLILSRLRSGWSDMDAITKPSRKITRHKCLNSA